MMHADPPPPHSRASHESHRSPLIAQWRAPWFLHNSTMLTFPAKPLQADSLELDSFERNVEVASFDSRILGPQQRQQRRLRRSFLPPTYLTLSSCRHLSCLHSIPGFIRSIILSRSRVFNDAWNLWVGIQHQITRIRRYQFFEGEMFMFTLFSTCVHFYVNVDDFFSFHLKI